MALLLRYVAASVRSQAQYPGSVVLLTIGHFLTTGLDIVALWALTDRFGHVRGWRFGEILTFYGLVHTQ